MTTLFMLVVFLVIRGCLFLIEKQQNVVYSKTKSLLYFLILVISGFSFMLFMRPGFLAFMGLEVTGLSNLVAIIIVIYFCILGGRFGTHIDKNNKPTTPE